MAREPRSTALPFLAAVLAAGSLAAGTAPAAPPPSGPDDDPVAALLQEFRCAFTPALCPSSPRATGEQGPRCFQPQVARFEALRPSMDAATAAEFERYLRARQPAGRSGETYVSPLGLFEFTYETSGPDSVPTEDVDPANGIPDFVERCAEYADFSWTVQAALGFTPPLLPSDGTYDITFQAFGGTLYGYTDIWGPTTTIVLNSTFDAWQFPSNPDPDGPVLGRAKVTIAHELRHASQYTNSGWSEGPAWLELDAAAIEDLVFPLTDDYLNFLRNNSLSQLDSPWTPMDSVSVIMGGYEDCLWNHYLSGSYGTQLLADLWEIRASVPTLPMIESYAQAQALYSTGWHESYPRYLEWCWFTDTRAIPGFGFPDAAVLYRMELTESTNEYPYAAADTVRALAGHPRRFNKGTASGYPRVRFDGDDAAGHFTVSVLAVEPDLSFTIVRPALDASNDLDYRVPIRFPDLKYAGVIVTNSDLDGEDAAYTLIVEDDPATSVDAAGGGGHDVPAAEETRPRAALALAAPSPNPARGACTFRWWLDTPRPVTLRVLDVNGRTVRTLRREAPSGSAGSARWDGRTDDGARAPAGVYWVRLEAANDTAARRVVLVR